MTETEREILKGIEGLKGAIIFIGFVSLFLTLYKIIEF